MLTTSTLCALCGKPATEDNPLEVDHIQPVSFGGTDHPSNLRAIHRRENRQRSNTGGTGGGYAS